MSDLAPDRGLHKWKADSFVAKSATGYLYLKCVLCGAVDGTPEADRPCPESPATLRDLAELRAELMKVIVPGAKP